MNGGPKFAALLMQKAKSDFYIPNENESCDDVDRIRQERKRSAQKAHFAFAEATIMVDIYVQMLLKGNR
jgi:hypothetical protein